MRVPMFLFAKYQFVTWQYIKRLAMELIFFFLLQVREKRGREEDNGETIEQTYRKRIGGITASNIEEMENKNKTENFRHHDEEDHTSRMTESTPLSLSPPKPAATPLNLNSPAKTAIEDSKAFTPKQTTKGNSIKPDFAALGLDLNDPLQPYNKLGRGSSPSSECGSTTGQAEISESMKKWIEMKRNGFVSIVNVKRPPIPRPKRHQSIKKKELDERIRVHHPAQLFSGLNPGIIKHVRNSKQVNSIIKAMLQNEMLEKHRPQHLKRQSEEQFSDSDIWKNKFNHESYTNTLESDDDDLTLKLSYSATRSTDQEDITSLSVKAAVFALQWLKLIQHDLSARQAAIKRSKNRVKNAVEVEMPYLFSRDLQPRQEIGPSLAPSFLTRCSQKETFNVHLARWKAVFTQMEVSLNEEENHLETWLRQVEELKSQCQEGLRFVSTNGFLHLDDAKELRILKRPEAYEREFAVRAGAASIYSTCDMIMTAKNVPYFSNKN